jgi:hypothetical protein
LTKDYRRAAHRPARLGFLMVLVFAAAAMFVNLAR